MHKSLYFSNLIKTGSLLLLILYAVQIGYSQACQYKTGDPIALTITGFNNAPEYQQQYVLTSNTALSSMYLPCFLSMG